jgi:hypothetical protein
LRVLDADASASTAGVPVADSVAIAGETQAADVPTEHRLGVLAGMVNKDEVFDEVANIMCFQTGVTFEQACELAEAIREFSRGRSSASPTSP